MKIGESMKKGFTLIELLAVILILGVIALIAVPRINNIVEEARVGAAKRNADVYKQAVENMVAIKALHNETLVDGVYTVAQLKDDIKIKNTTPDSGSITLHGGSVVSCNLFISGYTVICNGDDYTVVKGTGSNFGGTISNNTSDQSYLKILYMNPANLADTCNSSNAISTTLTNSGCMKFYIFKETSTTYTAILDHNTTINLVSNTMTELREKLTTNLNNATSAWDANITARLMNQNDVDITVRNDDYTKSQKAWLVDHLLTADSVDGEYPQGYFTSIPDGENYQYNVEEWGGLSYASRGENASVYSGRIGIRPVIEIPKAILE
jgi:type IV pilus assembly protein PilA